MIDNISMIIQNCPNPEQGFLFFRTKTIDFQQISLAGKPRSVHQQQQQLPCFVRRLFRDLLTAKPAKCTAESEILLRIVFSSEASRRWNPVSDRPHTRSVFRVLNALGGTCRHFDAIWSSFGQRIRRLRTPTPLDLESSLHRFDITEMGWNSENRWRCV